MSVNKLPGTPSIDIKTGKKVKLPSTAEKEALFDAVKFKQIENFDEKQKYCERLITEFEKDKQFLNDKKNIIEDLLIKFADNYQAHCELFKLDQNNLMNSFSNS